MIIHHLIITLYSISFHETILFGIAAECETCCAGHVIKSEFEEHSLQSLRRQGRQLILVSAQHFCPVFWGQTFLPWGSCSIFPSCGSGPLTQVPWTVPLGPQGWTCVLGLTIITSYSFGHNNWSGDASKDQLKKKKSGIFLNKAGGGKVSFLSGQVAT